MKVADGDTITIDFPYGRKSGKYLSQAVAGKHVMIEYEKRDRYKRIIGKVLLSGQDMNLRQVKAGLAWHYKKYQREQTPADRDLYSEAEIMARETGQGLWQEADPVPPWDWRKIKR